MFGQLSVERSLQSRHLVYGIQPLHLWTLQVHHQLAVIPASTIRNDDLCSQQLLISTANFCLRALTQAITADLSTNLPTHESPVCLIYSEFVLYGNMIFWYTVMMYLHYIMSLTIYTMNTTDIDVWIMRQRLKISYNCTTYRPTRLLLLRYYNIEKTVLAWLISDHLKQLRAYK